MACERISDRKREAVSVRFRVRGHMFAKICLIISCYLHLCFLNFHLAAAVIHMPSHFLIFMLFLGRDRGFVMGSLLL